MKKKDWEKEFDELNRKFWSEAEGTADLDYWAPKEYETIKKSITKLLKEQRKEILKEIKGMKQKTTGLSYENGLFILEIYNEAIDNIIEKLNK